MQPTTAVHMLDSEATGLLYDWFNKNAAFPTRVTLTLQCKPKHPFHNVAPFQGEVLSKGDLQSEKNFRIVFKCWKDKAFWEKVFTFVLNLPIPKLPYIRPCLEMQSNFNA